MQITSFDQLHLSPEVMQAIADMSSENAETVATQLAALGEGRNPFPANLLSIPSAPVK